MLFQVVRDVVLPGEEGEPAALSEARADWFQQAARVWMANAADDPAVGPKVPRTYRVKAEIERVWVGEVGGGRAGGRWS